MERSRSPQVVTQRNREGQAFEVVKAKSVRKTITIPRPEDLSQRDYDDAKKYSQNPSVLKSMERQEGRYVSPEEIESRILAEKMKNSNSELLKLSGGKEDYNLRSVIGYNNLKSTGEKSSYNEGNYLIYKKAQKWLRKFEQVDK